MPYYFCNDSDSSGVCIQKERFYGILIPILFGLAAISSLNNFFVLYLTTRIRQKITSSLKLVISLAVADTYTSIMLAVGLFVNSYMPFVLHWYPRNIGLIALLVEGMRLGGITSSVYHLLVLAINHFFNIRYPTKYHAGKFGHLITVTIILLWILPLPMYFIFFGLVPGQMFRSEYYDHRLVAPVMWGFHYRAVIGGVILLLPISIMIILYTSAYMELSVGCNTLEQNENHLSVSARTRLRNRFNRKKKVLKIALMIVATFLGGWLPAILIFLLSCDTCFLNRVGNHDVLIALAVTSNVFILLKTFINPIIYAVKINEVKQALVGSICCGPLVAIYTCQVIADSNERITLPMMEIENEYSNLMAITSTRNHRLHDTGHGTIDEIEVTRFAVA